jgi:hypothetical protein
MRSNDIFGRLQPLDPFDLEAILGLFRFHVAGAEVTQAIRTET